LSVIREIKDGRQKFLQVSGVKIEGKYVRIFLLSIERVTCLRLVSKGKLFELNSEVKVMTQSEERDSVPHFETWEFVPEYEGDPEDIHQETELQRQTARSIMDNLSRTKVQENLDAWFDRGCQKQVEELTWDEVRIPDDSGLFDATDRYLGYEICTAPFILENYNADGTMKPERYQFLFDSGANSSSMAREELRVRKHLRQLTDLVLRHGKIRAGHLSSLFPFA
jgi:hypothetical protein